MTAHIIPCETWNETVDGWEQEEVQILVNDTSLFISDRIVEAKDVDDVNYFRSKYPKAINHTDCVLDVSNGVLKNEFILSEIEHRYPKVYALLAEHFDL